MKERVAVLHHPISVFPLDLFAQVGDVAELVWVVDETCNDRQTCRLLERLGPTIDVSGLSTEAAAARLTAAGVRGVVSFVDDRLAMGAALAAQLGLRFHSPSVVRSFLDKRAQREILARAGVPGPRYVVLREGPPDQTSAEALERFGYPAVLKPARGSGSVGIDLVRSAEDLFRRVRDGEGWLLEQYLPDDPEVDPRFASYLSVESVVSAGRISHVALTGRFPLAEPFRETGNFVPALVRDDERDDVLTMARDAIAALGVTDSVVHTEIKLTPEGPMLIEVNGRLGGRPPYVLRSVSETNLFEAACRVALGQEICFPELATCDGVGFWFMVQPPVSATRVRAIDGLDAVAAMDGVEFVDIPCAPGDDVDWRKGTASRVLSVRGRTTDHQALAERIESINNKLTISYVE